jgi:hypothetical protein
MKEAIEQLENAKYQQERQIDQADHNLTHTLEQLLHWTNRKKSAREAVVELEAAIKLIDSANGK